MADRLSYVLIQLLAYVERRLPALTRLRKSETLPIALHRRRIYVLPTRFGLGFSALLLVMFIGALNYSNNSAILMTCLLGSAAGISLFIGFRTFNGIELTAIHAGECHAGDPLALRFAFSSGSRNRSSLRLCYAKLEMVFSLPAIDLSYITLDVATTARGWHQLERIKLWTDYPLGLFHIWSWLHPDINFLVYPTTEIPAPPLPIGHGHEGEHSLRGKDDDFSNLRDYQRNDPRRLVAWKASARHESLLVRQNEPHGGVALVLEYATLSPLDHEARIRRLTAWILSAEAQGLVYTLVVPNESIGPGLGANHRHACLRALALLPYAS